MPCLAWRSTLAAIVVATLWLASAADAADVVPDGVDCTAAKMQSDLTRCAHDELLAANRIHAERLAALREGLSSAQRNRLRQVEQAWVQYRTAACRFETDPAQVGSARSELYRRCATRMTLERAEALDRLARCAEGDPACNRPAQ